MCSWWTSGACRWAAAYGLGLCRTHVHALRRCMSWWGEGQHRVDTQRQLERVLDRSVQTRVLDLGWHMQDQRHNGTSNLPLRRYPEHMAAPFLAGNPGPPPARFPAT